MMGLGVAAPRGMVARGQRSLEGNNMPQPNRIGVKRRGSVQDRTNADLLKVPLPAKSLCRACASNVDGRTIQYLENRGCGAKWSGWPIYNLMEEAPRDGGDLGRAQGWQVAAAIGRARLSGGGREM